MTHECDKCQKSDHESCMRVVCDDSMQEIVLCRTCISKDFKHSIFRCDCGKCGGAHKIFQEWTDGHFYKCDKCKSELGLVYPKLKTYHEYLAGNKPIFTDVKTENNVDHPAHYQGNGMEAIDVIEAFGLGFNLGNAIKYLLRADKKGARTEDFKKAIWYINREIEGKNK